MSIASEVLENYIKEYGGLSTSGDAGDPDSWSYYAWDLRPGEIDAVSAMIVSFRTVLVNKGPMLFWGAIIAVSSMIAMIPLFLGMLVVFPVLGHATWHLYKKAVEPD